jgi:hypothetical protein
MIKAIRVWLTDSAPQTFGKPDGPYKEFSFEPAERITKMSLWGNGAGTRTGWIYFETNKNKRFDHGMTKWGRKQEYPIDVASGICVGVMGRGYDDIDMLGFVFLKPISSARLTNITYPTLELDSHGIMPETLDQYTDINTTSSPRNWQFEGSRKLTTSSSWSITTGLEVHSTITVEAGIPAVASVGVEAGWKVSASGTHQTTSETERTVSWQQSGTLQPGESISLKAVTRKGDITVPYDGSMEITLNSGARFSYPLRGQYKGVSYTGVTVTDSNS